MPEADWRKSPETPEQEALVRSWPVTDGVLRLRRALAKTAETLEARELPTLREMRDLTPALRDALAADYGSERVGGGKTMVPGWPDAGNVDAFVRHSGSSRGLSLAAELKSCHDEHDKVHEGIWDLFKMALLTTRADVEAALLVTAASEAVWTKAFCRDLFVGKTHSPVELCARRFPAGSRRLVWDWLLEGGYDRFPRWVPSEITTRLVADEMLVCGQPWRLRAVLVGVRGDAVVPFGGWPDGKRPSSAKQPPRTVC